MTFLRPVTRVGTLDNMLTAVPSFVLCETTDNCLSSGGCKKWKDNVTYKIYDFREYVDSIRVIVLLVNCPYLG